MTANRIARRADEATDVLDAAPDLSTVVAVAWPTGRPIHRYTAAELAIGVDLYTQAMKAKAAARANRGDHDAPER